MPGSKSLFLLIVYSMTSILDGQTLGGPMHGKVVVCYVASWAVYRIDPGKFELNNIEPSLCTHLVYAFAGLATNNTIMSIDPWQNYQKDNGNAGYKGMVDLKQRYPHLTVTVAIGGWNEGSPKYSKMAETAESRKVFIDSVLQFLEQYKFDGFDLDWEYPTRREGKPEDKENYVSLVKELKQAFGPRGYILTAALGVGKEVMDSAYDLPKLNRYLDFIHLMCYDYHGKWDGVVGANAPLTGLSEDDPLSVVYSINYMIKHGVSPSKMVLGLPMYGRTFLLRDPTTNVIEFGRTPTQEEAFAGPLTNERGFMGFNEICREVNNKSLSWTYTWHEQTGTPYIRDGEKVVTYDNERSIARKVKLAVDKGLRGLMVWSVDTDDFRGSCGTAQDAYADFIKRYNELVDDPLLNEALKTLKLPDMGRPETLGRGTAYAVSNGRLHLHLPEPEFSNYALMRIMNEAATLALSEKKIRDEMTRVTTTNEVEDKPNKPGSAHFTVSCTSVVFLCVLMSLLRFY